MGRVDCLVFRVGGIVFGQVGTFILGNGDAVIKEQAFNFAQLSKRPLGQCSFGLNMMVLSSVLCEMWLGVEAGAAPVAVGALETESMVNAFLVVVKTGGVILCL